MGSTAKVTTTARTTAEFCASSRSKCPEIFVVGLRFLVIPDLGILTHNTICPTHCTKECDVRQFILIKVPRQMHLSLSFSVYAYIYIYICMYVFFVYFMSYVFICMRSVKFIWVTGLVMCLYTCRYISVGLYKHVWRYINIYIYIYIYMYKYDI